MKIIIAGPAYPYRGGPASFNDRLAQKFSGEGHEVEVITFSLQYPGLLFPGKTQYTDGDAPEGVKIKRKLNSINPINWILLGYKIKKAKPDILLLRFWLPFFGPSFGTLARIVKRNRKTVVVSIFDNVIPHEKRPGDRILTSFFIGSIDGAIVMSASVLNDLIGFRRNIPVTLSPHPLFDGYGSIIPREKALSLLNLGTDNSYLLFFGFIRAYKGLDLLLKAFADKRLADSNLKLIVAGEFYEDARPYMDLISKLNIGDNVILYDHFIRDDEVSQLFSAADLIVQPYKSATQSGVTQIAFHFEKPMLVTDVGGLREIVDDGKCGYVVEPQVSDIADAIVDYFENDRKSEFTEGVKRAKGKFSWDKMTAAISDLYNEIST